MQNPIIRRFDLHISVILLGLAAASANAADWPRWRGENRDGVWSETGIVECIPDQGLAVRWRAKVSNGYSAPSVAAGRVFITDHVFEPELERVLCFDEATGRQLWMHRYAVDYKDMEYGNGPRAAPTVADGKVYTLGTQGHLFSLLAQEWTMRCGLGNCRRKSKPQETEWNL